MKQGLQRSVRRVAAVEQDLQLSVRRRAAVKQDLYLSVRRILGLVAHFQVERCAVRSPVRLDQVTHLKTWTHLRSPSWKRFIGSALHLIVLEEIALCQS